MKRKISMLITMILTLSLIGTISFTAGAEAVTPTATWITQPSGWEIVDGLEYGSKLYTDNNVAEYLVDEFEDEFGLYGATYIKTEDSDTLDYKSMGTWNSQDPVGAVSVNNSCDIYVFTPWVAPALDGAEFLKWLSSPAYGFERIKNSDGSFATIPVKKIDGTDSTYNVYKRTLNIPAGTSAKIEFGFVGGWNEGGMYTAAIVWHEDQDEAIDSHNIEITSTRSTRNYVINRNVQINDPVFSDDTVFYVGDTDVGAGVYPLDYYGLEGADAIMLPYWDLNDSTFVSSSNSKDVWTTFTVDHNAEIYVVSPTDDVETNWDAYMNWLNNFGFFRVNHADGTAAKTRVKAGSVNFNNGANPSSNMYLFKKSVYVKEGEKTAVNLGRVGAWCDPPYAVIVKWIDEHPAKTAFVTNNEAAWQVENNVDIIEGSNNIRLYYDQEDNFFSELNGLDFTGVSVVKPSWWDYGMPYSAKTHQTLETVTVNNSCEVYVMSRYAPAHNWLTWIDTQGYEKQNVTVNSTKSLAEGFSYQVFKKTFLLADGETMEIPIGASTQNMVNCSHSVVIKWIDNPEEKPLRLGVELAEGVTEEYYVVNDKTFNGDRILVGYDMTVKDYGKTGLAGAFIVKPYNPDIFDKQYSTEKTPEDLNEIPVFDWYTLTLEKTADVYVLTNKEADDIYHKWLKGWELVTDENGDPALVDIMNGAKAAKGMVYKRTFAVPEGETREVKIRNAGATASMISPVYVKYVDATTYTINIKVNGEGSEVYPFEKTADVKAGESTTLNFGFLDGYYVKSVKYNGAEVLSDIWEDDYTWKTPAVNSDATVEVIMGTTDEIPVPSVIESSALTFSAKGTEDLIVDYKVYPLNVITFATAKEKVGAHIRGDYGMLISIKEPASVNDLTIDAENIYKASAKGTNAKGQYGIRIYGGKVQSGQKIYARAYAYYGDTLVYGDKLIEAEF